LPTGESARFFFVAIEISSQRSAGQAGNPCAIIGSMLRVLFVCTANICRSPMAEAVFARMVERAGLAGQIEVDSAATGPWYVGEPAHPGTRAVLRRHGIEYVGCARQVTVEDLDRADYVVAMDARNLVDLAVDVDPGRVHAGKVRRLLEDAPAGSPLDVPDPYVDGQFEVAYALVEVGCRGLLARVRADRGL